MKKFLQDHVEWVGVFLVIATLAVFASIVVS